MSTTTQPTQEEQQKMMEQQRQYMMQQQKMMQKQMYSQQIYGALSQVSAFKVLKTAASYGIRFNLDYNSKSVLAQKLYQAFIVSNKSENEEEWTTLANATMAAYQQTMQQMLFQHQMGGMQQMPGMNPGMMGGMGMGMPMMGNGFGGAMPGMNPMMMGGMQGGMMPGMNPGMMGMGMGMPMMGMQQPAAQATKDGEKPNNVANLKSYVAGNIFNVDPIIFMSTLMNNGVDFDDSSLESVLGQALTASIYYMDDNTLMYFYQVVLSLYTMTMQQGKDGNAAPNQQNAMGMGMMNPMMGGMGMQMMGMNPMMMGGMQQMPGMNPGMMGGMGMGMPMPMMGNGFGGAMPGMNPMMMGGMQGGMMPGMNGGTSGLNALY